MEIYCKKCKYHIDSAPGWTEELKGGFVWCIRWNKPVPEKMRALACWRQCSL